MFIDFAKQMVRKIDGVATLSMPFPSDDIAWPLVQPRRDSGKWVMGLFEGGRRADGVRVHGVSTWTTPRDIVGALSKESRQEVKFNPIPASVFQGILAKTTGEEVAQELTETQILIGEYSYYGKGEEKNQKKHDEWLIEGAETISFPQWVKENAPWTFQ